MASGESPLPLESALVGALEWPGTRPAKPRRVDMDHLFRAPAEMPAPPLDDALYPTQLFMAKRMDGVWQFNGQTDDPDLIARLAGAGSAPGGVYQPQENSQTHREKHRSSAQVKISARKTIAAAALGSVIAIDQLVYGTLKTHELGFGNVTLTDNVAYSAGKHICKFVAGLIV